MCSSIIRPIERATSMSASVPVLPGIFKAEFTTRVAISRKFTLREASGVATSNSRKQAHTRRQHALSLHSRCFSPLKPPLRTLPQQPRLPTVQSAVERPGKGSASIRRYSERMARGWETPVFVEPTKCRSAPKAKEALRPGRWKTEALPHQLAQSERPPAMWRRRARCPRLRRGRSWPWPRQCHAQAWPS